MNAPPRPAGTPRARRRWPRRLLWWCALPLGALLLVLIALAWLLPPQRVVPLVLDRLGDALGLQIRAEGDPASRLGRHPGFVVRAVTVRAPGAERPLLEARRILVAVPWATLRGLGASLDLVRIELDAPVLDVPALQQWLSTRPSGDARLPTLAEGLHIRDGRVLGDGWTLEALQLSLPKLQTETTLRAQARGVYVDGDLRAPFSLASTLMALQDGRGFGLAGSLSPARDDWRLPGWIQLSGRLSWRDGLRLDAARFGSQARYLAGGTTLPFALGLHGPLRWQGGTLALSPAAVALHGEGLVPTLAARGALALDEGLALRLDGHLARWPETWPALPPPLGASTAPVAIALDYHGGYTLDAPLQLRLARDDVRFSGQLAVPALLTWSRSPGVSPLPPLQGRVEARAMELSGARLQGVVVEFEDDAGTEATP